MADLVQVVAQAGPLPIKQAVQIETDAPTVVTLAGSVWSVDESYMVGISLSIDGAVVAKAPIYANSPAMHLAVVPQTFAYTFPDTPNQEHVFELDKLTGETMSDANDFFVVTVQY
jgi:hypothetical protein